MVLTETDSTQTVRERVQRSVHYTFESGLHKLSFHAMSTICRVHFETSDSALARDLQTEILRWIGWFEARYSRFIPDSLISRINAAGREGMGRGGWRNGCPFHSLSGHDFFYARRV